MKHIGVFQIWGLGDLVMTTPVIAEIRREMPETKISLFVRGKVQTGLMATSSLLDNIAIVPRNESVLKQAAFFVDLRSKNIDVAYIGTRTSPFLALLLRYVSGIKTIVGDAQSLRFAYTHAGAIDPRTHRVNRMLYNLSLWTGQPASEPVFPIPIASAARQEAERIMASVGLTRGMFLTIHPGSSGNLGKEKRLPYSLVADLAERIRRNNREFRVAVILGPDDMDLQNSYEALGASVILLKSLPLDVTKQMLEYSTCFVGSDSALGHIAAAFGTPTITIAGPTNPNETRPYGMRSRVLTLDKPLPCQPCWGTALQGHCPFDARCMREVSPQALYDVVSQHLATPATTKSTHEVS